MAGATDRRPVVDGQARVGIRRNAVILAVSAVAVRAVVAVIYKGPSISPDSGSYVGMSRILFSLGSNNYVGLRTPGYPLTIRVLGSNLDAVWFAQAGLGAGACLLVYAVVAQLTGRSGLALGTGILLSLSIDVLFFETEILTEAAVLFLLTASLYAFVQLVTKEESLRWALVLGLLSGLAALTRPESALLIIVWPAAFVMVRVRLRTPPPTRFRMSWRLTRVAAMVTPGVLAVAAWSGVNAHLVGQFSPTTLSGLNLVDHLGPSVSSAPARYSTLRDIYVATRTKSIAQGHGDRNISYEALPAMEKATGKSQVALSRELTSMSLAVIEHHPTGYASVTAKSWLRSWDAPIYWQPDNLHPSIVRSVVKALWKGERPVRILINIAFLALCASALAPSFRRDADPARRLAMTIMGVVVVMSLPQALLANGENGRYLFPYLPMILVSLVLGIAHWSNLRHRRNSLSGSNTHADPSTHPDRWSGTI